MKIGPNELRYLLNLFFIAEQHVKNPSFKTEVRLKAATVLCRKALENKLHVDSKQNVIDVAVEVINESPITTSTSTTTTQTQE